MSVSYDLDQLPYETVGMAGRVWDRERFDKDAYQWMRPMGSDEHDRDGDEVQNISLSSSQIAQNCLSSTVF